MAELARDGWIDDARFARAWVRDRLALRPSGRRRLRAELMVRGVPAQVADDAITATLPEGAEDALALVQAKARFRRMGALSPPVAHRRLVGWLRRRGFGADAIARALRGLKGAHVDDPNDDPAA
jgi:regulatory protein